MQAARNEANGAGCIPRGQLSEQRSFLSSSNSKEDLMRDGSLVDTRAHQSFNDPAARAPSMLPRLITYHPLTCNVHHQNDEEHMCRASGVPILWLYAHHRTVRGLGEARRRRPSEPLAQSPIGSFTPSLLPLVASSAPAPLPASAAPLD